VEADDAATLVRVPGIGRKTAERLIIEMRDRLEFLGGPATGGLTGVPAGTQLSPQAEAFTALVALGYKPAEVTRLLQKVGPSVTSTEEMIRHALRAAAG
jgi:Holliday junction DNA helicase RuvA